MRPASTVAALGPILVALAAVGAPAHAQSGPLETDPGRPAVLGMWFGPESLPSAMDPSCGRSEGTTDGLLAGASVLVPVGPLALEGSVARYFGRKLACPGGLLERNGVHTSHDSQLRVGDFTTTEATLRLSLDRGARLVVGAGAGWAWSKDVPYATWSVGFRGGHALQAGVDVAMRLYRIPWKLHTGEYAFGEEVRVIADESYHDWMRAIVVRLGVAYPLFRL